MAVNFIGGGNKSLEKTIDLSQVTDKLYNIILYQEHLAMNSVQTHNFSCKSNYHTITTTLAPPIIV